MNSPYIDESLAVMYDFHDKIRNFKRTGIDKGYSQDIYGYPVDAYKDVMTLNYIGMMIMLMAYEMRMYDYTYGSDEYKALYAKYKMRLMKAFIRCLGIRTEVIGYDENPSMIGIGYMGIEDETNPFQIE